MPENLQVERLVPEARSAEGPSAEGPNGRPDTRQLARSRGVERRGNGANQPLSLRGRLHLNC
jgi:hypothetical protein